MALCYPFPIPMPDEAERIAENLIGDPILRQQIAKALCDFANTYIMKASHIANDNCSFCGNRIGKEIRRLTLGTGEKK